MSEQEVLRIEEYCTGVEQRLAAQVLDHVENQMLRQIMRWLWGIAGGVAFGLLGVASTWFTMKAEIAETFHGFDRRMVTVETWKAEREKAIEEYELFRRQLAADIATFKASQARQEEQLRELLRRTNQ